MTVAAPEGARRPIQYGYPDGDCEPVMKQKSEDGCKRFEEDDQAFHERISKIGKGSRGAQIDMRLILLGDSQVDQRIFHARIEFGKLVFKIVQFVAALRQLFFRLDSVTQRADAVLHDVVEALEFRALRFELAREQFPFCIGVFARFGFLLNLTELAKSYEC